MTTQGQPDTPLRVPRIDAHQHFWQPARGDYGWLDHAPQAIRRDFMPADLEPLLARHAIDATVLVQAAPTVEETRWLLSLAERWPPAAGVVGWADFAAPDVAARIAAADHPLLVGLRPMLQDIADPRWVLDHARRDAFEACAGHSLVFDALVQPRHLPVLAELAARHPALAIVVDHAAKPEIASRRIDHWRSGLRTLAAHANVCCKLSGLASEAAPSWTVAELRGVADEVLATFGPARVLWGSDWPVLQAAGGYDRWCDASDALLAPLAHDERAAVLGGNARRIYLGRRGRRPPC